MEQNSEQKIDLNVNMKEKFKQGQISWWKRIILYALSLRKCKLSKNWTKFFDTVPRTNFTKIFTFYCCEECILKSMFVYIHWKLNYSDRIMNASTFFQDTKYKELFINCLSIKSMKNYSETKTKWLKISTRILIKLEMSYINNFVLLGNSKNERDKKILEGNFFSILDENLRDAILKKLELPNNTNDFSIKDFYDRIKEQNFDTIIEICRILDNTKLF